MQMQLHLPRMVILHLDFIQILMKRSLMGMIFKGKTQSLLQTNQLFVFPMMISMKSSPVGLLAKKPVILLLIHPLNPLNIEKGSDLDQPIPNELDKAQNTKTSSTPSDPLMSNSPDTLSSIDGEDAEASGGITELSSESSGERQVGGKHKQSLTLDPVRPLELFYISNQDLPQSPCHPPNPTSVDDSLPLALRRQGKPRDILDI